MISGSRTWLLQAPWVCALLFAGPVYACLVVSVPDGDTLTLFCDGEQREVDLDEIDAPELQQEFGARAQRSLSDMCLRRNARLLDERTDEEGRTYARVLCDGVPAAAEQLRRGMAWVAQTHAEDKTLHVAQNIARHAGHGLWAGEAPVAPWEWRRVAAAEAEAATRRTVVQRTPPPPPAEPDNAIVSFFKRLFGR